MTPQTVRTNSSPRLAKLLEELVHLKDFTVSEGLGFGKPRPEAMLRGPCPTLSIVPQKAYFLLLDLTIEGEIQKPLRGATEHGNPTWRKPLTSHSL